MIRSNQLQLLNDVQHQLSNDICTIRKSKQISNDPKHKLINSYKVQSHEKIKLNK
jgi:hypothetical protein